MYEQLFEDNHGLIATIARKYTWAINGDPAIDFDDLMQTGFIGLVRAQETFSAEAGAWSTWATLNISYQIRRFLGLRDSKALKLQYSALSLDAPIVAGGDSDGATLADTLADDSLEPMEDTAERSDTVKRIRAAVDALPEDQRRIVTAYIENGMTATTAAEALGMEPRRFTYILHKAFYTLANNRNVRVFVGLDHQTRFISHKSAEQFQRDWTSDVEAEVLKRLDHTR